MAEFSIDTTSAATPTYPTKKASKPNSKRIPLGQRRAEFPASKNTEVDVLLSVRLHEKLRRVYGKAKKNQDRQYPYVYLLGKVNNVYVEAKLLKLDFEYGCYRMPGTNRESLNLEIYKMYRKSIIPSAIAYVGHRFSDYPSIGSGYRQVVIQNRYEFVMCWSRDGMSVRCGLRPRIGDSLTAGLVEV